MSAIPRFLTLPWRWKRTAKPPVIRLNDPALRVVARSFDETEAASTALARADRWQAESPAVLRHHLLLPEAGVATARELLTQDDWTLSPLDPGSELREEGLPVIAERVQRIDALHCSQESSRMAGLAQRLHGRALGWEVLQPVGDAVSD